MTQTVSGCISFLLSKRINECRTKFTFGLLVRSRPDVGRKSDSWASLQNRPYFLRFPSSSRARREGSYFFRALPLCVTRACLRSPEKRKK